jgi:hypothetical protein
VPIASSLVIQGLRLLRVEGELFGDGRNRGVGQLRVRGPQPGRCPAPDLRYVVHVPERRMHQIEIAQHCPNARDDFFCRLAGGCGNSIFERLSVGLPDSSDVRNNRTTEVIIDHHLSLAPGRQER